jgi:subtilisin family serine protease
LVLLFFALAVGGLTSPPTVAAKPGRVQLLVKFAPNVHERRAVAMVRGAGAQPVRVIRDLRVRVLSLPAGRASAALRNLRSSSSVVFAERDGIARIADTTPNDPYWPNETSQMHVNASQAWDLTRGSPQVVIAVLDTGVDSSQPDLQASFVAGYDFVNNDADPSDDHGHGTQAAGVAAARGNNLLGVAGYCWSCSIMGVKVLDSSGSGSMATVAQGITWAADHSARVISMSLAGSAGYSTLQSAVQYAHNKGAVLVAAAGNYGSSAPMYPAAYPQVLSVAGSNADDTLNANSDYGSWVKVAAPWCHWTTAKGGLFGTYCGTSSATPAIAGIAALAFSLSPTVTNTQVEQALQSSATPLFGSHLVQYGRVDALGTLLALGSIPSGTAPANSSLPAISGTALVGQTLNASPGSWTGSTPISYAYQWRRCDATGMGCADIVGATGQSYSVASADVGGTLRVAVTASNGYGSSAATSGASAPVLAAPAAPGTTTTTFTGSLNKKQSSRSFSVSVGTGQAAAALQFARLSSMSLEVQAANGSTVGSASGSSVLRLIASLPAGTYTYVVSGSGSVSFTLSVSYATP